MMTIMIKEWNIVCPEDEFIYVGKNIFPFLERITDSVKTLPTLFQLQLIF